MALLRSKLASEPQPPAGGLSIIAVGMTVTGDIDSNGTVKVEGTVEGHVRAKHQALVAKGGVVRGDIDAREAVIGGAVRGVIRALERVEIQSGAVVNGDITTHRIAVAEGGSLNGQIRMGEQPADQAGPAAAPAASGAVQPAGSNDPAEAAAPVSRAQRPLIPLLRVAVPPRLSTGSSE